MAIVAVDLGGTLVRTALVTGDGAVTARVEAPTPAEPAGLTSLLAEHARRLAGVAGSSGQSLVAAGISATGPVDTHAGLLLDPPNLPVALHGFDLCSPIASTLGVPTFVDRDTNAAARAEGQWGAGQGARDWIYITVSTGIGSTIIAGGRTLTGRDGAAGEFGHVPVVDDGSPCGCGETGHLEAVASGWGLARRAAAATGRPMTARDLDAAAANGDALADELMASARIAFGRAVVGLVNLVNPTRVVLGGSIALRARISWVEAVDSAIARSALRPARENVRVVPASLGDDAGLLGSSLLVLERLADGPGSLKTP